VLNQSFVLGCLFSYEKKGGEQCVLFLILVLRKESLEINEDAEKYVRRGIRKSSQ